MPSRREEKRWRDLRRRKGRAEHGLFLAEGPRVVRELLASRLRVRQILHTSAAADGATAGLLERATARGIAVEEVGRRELEEYADTVAPQGLLAAAEIPSRRWIDLETGDLLVVDGVQDPGNLGTLLRTAEAMGLAGAISLAGTVDAWNPKVVRAAAGSLFRLPVLDARWPETRARLEAWGVSVWVADPRGEPVERDELVPRRVALVLGNEGRGIRPRILERSDRRVAVRLRGPVESLNVAVAAALLMDRIFSARRA